MLTLEALAVGFLVLSSAFLLFGRLATASRRSSLPPGPKPLPIVGNMLDFPTVNPWLGFADWSKLYGGIVYLNLFGRGLLVINSAKIANDLFEKRSRIYSNRPPQPVVKLMGWDHFSGFLPYGDEWRLHRRLYTQHFRQDVIARYHDIEILSARQLVDALAKSPKEYNFHLRQFAVFLIVKLTYGIDLIDQNDPLMPVVDALANILSQPLHPGGHLVNALPILQYLPEWFPGGGFSAFARKCRRIVHELTEKPLELVKENLASGNGAASLASDLLTEIQTGEGNVCEEDIKNFVASVFAAGSDTTVSALQTFILAMTLNPEVQKKAQEEVDRIVGTDRLPTFEDRESMPYVEALSREVQRWHPVAPLQFYSTLEDDIYEGYFIPKGISILGNSWAMLHDATAYPDPEKFNPDRFLTPERRPSEESASIGYGFGRRICPGRFFASQSVWIAIATMLATLRFAKERDASGNEITPSEQYGDGGVSHPHPFETSITSRSLEARHIVEASLRDY